MLVSLFNIGFIRKVPFSHSVYVLYTQIPYVCCNHEFEEKKMMIFTIYFFFANYGSINIHYGLYEV